jgi:hypothetical protein
LGDLHEQTSLTAGTIADDDELATDLGHLDKRVSMEADEKETMLKPRKLKKRTELRMSSVRGCQRHEERFEKGTTWRGERRKRVNPYGCRRNEGTFQESEPAITLKVERL